YMGNKLIAEYQPVIAKYYYYTSDQINSTRIITDSTGTVVYSAVFDPYGGLQKQWVNTYSPTLKFSGKERESKSELDYFGARYYDHMRYRFISVDPMINKDEALANPQLWNLYSYCRNNPISFLDPDGRDIFQNISEWWGGTPLKHFLSGDTKGGFQILIKNLAEQMSDPAFAANFIGGISVIGPRSTYKIFAKKIDAKFLNVADKDWSWSKNIKFLKGIVERGDEVKFAGKFNPARLNPDSILAKEIGFLQKHGYKWTVDFTKLVPAK
ncbi:MAG: RHS repeat-associated core domain-containing protein, partial [Thermodesulfovibrionales bacterium]|nr:RHS repeat-associated core domain-containing protein [Thermodesulfovibrionales bacterium]